MSENVTEMSEIPIPQAILEAVARGDYQEALRLSDEAADEKRFINTDWEIIHRMAATAAFVLSGGLQATDMKLLERARKEAVAAGQRTAIYDFGMEEEHCYNIALYCYAAYGLGEKDRVLDYLDRARHFYPASCDLALAAETLMFKENKMEEGIRFAQEAIKMAEEQGRQREFAAANWVLGLAYEKMVLIDDVRACVQKAIDMYEMIITGGAADAASRTCLNEAKQKIKKLA